MKQVGFIGVYDKIDFIIYIAKVLTMLDKKVLVIDNTIMQKAKYIVPVINPTKAYITEFEKIDISVGFSNYDEIKKYLGMQQDKPLDYDIVLIDIDNIENFNNFNIEKNDRNYFVTSFDLYSLRKGLEILDTINKPIELTKVIFSKDILKEENEYLNYVSLGKKVVWNEEYVIYLPLDNGDRSVIIENQRVSKIGIRKLSDQYKESLYYIVEDILQKEVRSGEIKKAFRLLEKEV